MLGTQMDMLYFYFTFFLQIKCLIVSNGQLSDILLCLDSLISDVSMTSSKCEMWIGSQVIAGSKTKSWAFFFFFFFSFTKREGESEGPKSF